MSFPQGFNDYGIDWEGPVPCDDESIVEIQETLCPMQSSRLCELNNYINRLSDSDLMGVDLYVSVLGFVCTA